MEAFHHMMSAIPDGSTRRAYGTAYWDGAQWFANIGGNLIVCRWMDPIQPLQGGQIVVDITKEGRGLYTAWVMGGYTDQPRPSTGTVLTVGIAEIVFTGEDATVYATDRFIGSYTNGDLIFIDWAAGKPTIIGKIPNITVTPPATAPLPPGGGDITGTHRASATASDTWWAPGGWGSYATSQRGGEDVYSGSYFSGPTSGAWFYGPQSTVLAGKTIKQARFRLPARLNAGSYNDPATVHIYGHDSQSRPGGDVSRIVGPFNVAIEGRAGAQWVILPEEFHALLVAGGGISIAGDPYVGLQGRLKDPDSGKTELDWSN